MFKLFCFFLILNFLIYSPRKTLYIPGVTINTANNDNYYGLPNEVPALSSIFENLNKTKFEIIQSISNIIGLFPLSEQYAFYYSVNTSSGDQLFNYHSYVEKINENNLYNEQIKSLNNYLTEEENRKILSLGAIKKITAQFGFDSLDDENITIKIEENINEILNAQVILDQYENEFLNNLFKVFIERRGYLLDITLSNYNSNSERNKFLRDENKNYTIKGFFYTKEHSNLIIDSFKKFAYCHHYYNNILNYNAILSQIYIGQLDKCSNEEETNEFAGNSSNKVNYSIKYKGDTKIGVNVNDNVRYDSKTLNNYFLNYGFGLGKSYNKNDKSQNNYKFKISNELNYIINNISNTLIDIKKNSTFSSINSEIEEFEKLLNFDDDNEYRPFVNLARFLINTTIDEDKFNINNFDKDILQCYEQNTSLNNKKTSILINKNDEKINYNDFSGNNNPIDAKCHIENLCFDSYEIFFYSNESDIKLMIVLATYNKKKFFDLYWNGESYATSFYNTTTACFAAFSSLGKDDKDACRGVLTKKCGRELDYRCKESGFYDVILQNPVAENILPLNCLEFYDNGTYNDNACLKWLEVYLIKNGLIIKPSAISSFSLLMQAASRGYDSKNTRLMSIYGDSENPINNDTENNINNKINVNLNDFEIQNINENTQSINHLMSQVDKTFYLQLDHSINIKFSYIFLLLIIFLFN